MNGVYMSYERKGEMFQIRLVNPKRGQAAGKKTETGVRPAILRF